MPINSVSMMGPTAIAQPVKPTLHTTPGAAQQNFAASLKDAIAQVNNQQITSENDK